MAIGEITHPPAETLPIFVLPSESPTQLHLETNRQLPFSDRYRPRFMVIEPNPEHRFFMGIFLDAALDVKHVDSYEPHALKPEFAAGQLDFLASLGPTSGLIMDDYERQDEEHLNTRKMLELAHERGIPVVLWSLNKDDSRTKYADLFTAGADITIMPKAEPGSAYNQVRSVARRLKENANNLRDIEDMPLLETGDIVDRLQKSASQPATETAPVAVLEP